MIGKGLFHTHLVVRDLERSLRFYTGLFGMQTIDFNDGTLVFLTTPGRGDLLGAESRRRVGLSRRMRQRESAGGGPGWRAGRTGAFRLHVADPGGYERAIDNVTEFGGKLVIRCEHGGAVSHTYLADPDGYVVEIQYGG